MRVAFRNCLQSENSISGIWPNVFPRRPARGREPAQGGQAAPKPTPKIGQAIGRAATPPGAGTREEPGTLTQRWKAEGMQLSLVCCLELREVCVFITTGPIIKLCAGWDP
jgi:hypothetical protein